MTSEGREVTCHRLQRSPRGFVRGVAPVGLTPHGTPDTHRIPPFRDIGVTGRNGHPQSGGLRGVGLAPKLTSMTRSNDLPPQQTCPLCGQPADTHDQDACDAKMAAWQPTGIINTPGVVVDPRTWDHLTARSDETWLRALRRMQDAAILRRHG